MAPFLFMDAIMNQRPIQVFNRGNLLRDFTYIDDIIRGLVVVVENPPRAIIPYEIYNIGRGEPIRLPDFISGIEKVTGQKAIKQELEMQDGDVYQTFADTRKLETTLKYQPKISLEEGISRFYDWFIEYFRHHESAVG
jgi:UDP-glucuronate 4-epimerase